MEPPKTTTSKRATTNGPRQTIYTLAEKAGVSASTVARALRNDPAINVNTRQRIRELAEKTGFRRSRIAIRLGKGRTGTLAMLVPTTRNPVYAALSEAVMRVAAQTDHEVLVGYADNHAEHERQIIDRFKDAHIDGFILVPEFWAENCEHILALHQSSPDTPIVILANVQPDCPLDAVAVDFEPAMQEGIQCLAERGHRRIAYMGSTARAPVTDRALWFRREMRDVGLTVDPKLVVHCGPGVDDAYRSARELLGRHRPTALVVKADYHAFGALRAAAECQLRIPQDLSLISVDGIELGAYGYVPVTTWAIPVEAEAKALVASILARLDGDRSLPHRHTFLTKKIERGSVADCPAE